MVGESLECNCLALHSFGHGCGSAIPTNQHQQREETRFAESALRETHKLGSELRDSSPKATAVDVDVQLAIHIRALFLKRSVALRRFVTAPTRFCLLILSLHNRHRNAKSQVSRGGGGRPGISFISSLFLLAFYSHSQPLQKHRCLSHHRT